MDDGPADYGKTRDHWGRVQEYLKRRKLFRFAVVVLTVLYGVAIYAPLIANDRPYTIEAIDYRAYEAARKKIYFAVLGLTNILEKKPAEYLEGRVRGSTQSYADALRGEQRALENAVGTMTTYLSAADQLPLRAFSDEFGRLVEFGTLERRQEAARLVDELKTRARDLGSRFQAARPGAEDSGAGVLLHAQRSYPLFAALTALEVFFMVLFLWAVSRAVWRRRAKRRPVRRAAARAWSLVLPLAVSGLCAMLWWTAVGSQERSNYPAYKSGLKSGDLVAQHVLFPPIAMGLAESGSELNRPPTWHSSSEISAEGFYVRGLQKPAAPDAAGFVRPAAPVAVRFGEPERNSPWRHPLGTDGLGRDLLVRTIYGARISLAVGLVSTAILALIGILIGATAGYFGGRVDLLISRVIEVVICFPVLFLILGLVAFVGQSLLGIMLVIGLFRWTGMARLTRAEFLRLKELDFVVAARALGLSTPRILLRHMLPNAAGPLLVAASFSLSAGLLIESGLSFLGFGVREPIPSWGGLVRSSLSPAHWWVHLFPGLLIFLTVLCYNLIGDAIRDALDPKLN